MATVLGRKGATLVCQFSSVQFHLFCLTLFLTDHLFLFESPLFVTSWPQARGARDNRKTPRSQALAPQGPRKWEEEQTDRQTVKAHVQENRTGSRLLNAEKERILLWRSLGGYDSDRGLGSRGREPLQRGPCYNVFSCYDVSLSVHDTT